MDVDFDIEIRPDIQIHDLRNGTRRVDAHVHASDISLTTMHIRLHINMTLSRPEHEPPTSQELVRKTYYSSS